MFTNKYHATSVLLKRTARVAGALTAIVQTAGLFPLSLVGWRCMTVTKKGKDEARPLSEEEGLDLRLETSERVQTNKAKSKRRRAGSSLFSKLSNQALRPGPPPKPLPNQYKT